MRLHFPTLDQLLALFFMPTDVSKIVAGIHRQIEQLRNAVDHHLGQVDRYVDTAAALYKDAAAAEDRADAAKDEAVKAGRIADKLAALVA